MPIETRMILWGAGLSIGERLWNGSTPQLPGAARREDKVVDVGDDAGLCFTPPPGWLAVLTAPRASLHHYIPVERLT